MIEISENIQTYLNSLYGESSAQKYIDFISRDPVQYIRVNRLKTTRAELAATLKKEYSIETEAIPNISDGLKVIEGNNILGKTIEHIIGDYYIQGLSSMIPPLILSPKPEDVVLDLCSAPGSKTTELGELMDNKGTLIANEIALDRVKMLVFNIDRMNLVNAAVTHTRGELLSKIYSEHFDKILVDAPCSGLGIIQKKEEVSNWWSLDRAERLGDLQLRLLIAAVKMVKTGGEIVYSTCTLTPEENEFIIDKVLQKYPIELVDIELPVASQEAFTSYNGKELNPQLSKARRIIPWEVDSDGFFICKLRKTGETLSPEKSLVKQRDLKILSSKSKEIKNLLINIENDFGVPPEVLTEYNYLIKKNDIYFLNKNWEDDNLGLFERIGTRFGVIDKRGEITLHTLAAQILQKHISKNIVEFDSREDLKKYLEGGIVKKETSVSGQCVIKFRNSILGTAVTTEGGIKSRFPRAKRTHEIHLDF